jgi:hypothetical protein
MLNLAMSEFMAGANLWDAKGHVMSGSNDMATRTEIFDWVAAHQDVFSGTRVPIGNVGVYFSDATRNYGPREYIASYRGMVLLLLQAHIQFHIVTPRTLSAFTGSTLILPDVRVLSDAESSAVRRFQQQGGKVILTGQPDAKLNDIAAAVRFPDCPERSYLERASTHFDTVGPSDQPELLHAIQDRSELVIQAPRDVAAHAALVDGTYSIFFANFTGLQAGEVATPTPQHGITITVPERLGARMHVLPFLGKESVLSGAQVDGSIRFQLPTLDRGTVIWFSKPR